MVSVQLLIVDDSMMFRKALLQPLNQSDLIEIVGTAPDGEFALKMCQDPHCTPEVILLDLHMPRLNAFDLLKEIDTLPQKPRCLILTGDDDLQSALGVFRLGAAGYMLKDNVTEESLISSIIAVANGGVYIDEEIFEQMLDTQKMLVATATPSGVRLSQAERTLLRDVALGLDNKQISTQHGVTTKTVSNRLGLLYQKLTVHNRVEAAFYALQHGIISLNEI